MLHLKRIPSVSCSSEPVFGPSWLLIVIRSKPLACYLGSVVDLILIIVLAISRFLRLVVPFNSLLVLRCSLETQRDS
jgi:hypothetical protein